MAVFPLISFAAAQPGFRNSAPAPYREKSTASHAPSGTDGISVLPRDAYQTQPVGIPHSTLFRNTRLPSGSPLSLPPFDPSLRTESVQTRFRANLPSLSGGVPFLQRGFEPQDADLKLGPFYFKLEALQGAVLHSDNIYLRPEGEQESGTIAITSLTLSVVGQLTESLRIATSGSFVYLPLQGKTGIAGFGLGDLYAFDILDGPATRAQIVWETKIAGWNVVFADDFQILLGTYSNDVRSDYVLFEGGGFTEESRAGRYQFRPSGTQFSNDDRRDRNDFSDRSDIVVYSNIVSASADRLLPGSIRLAARIYREDLWYNQGNRGLPRLREGGIIRLASERKNMRFKPFISYETFRTDRDDSFQQIIRAGLDGPITDQLQLHVDAGYYFGGEGEGGEGTLWSVILRHDAGPYTKQSLSYSRNFSYFHDELIEGFGYNLQQILGPKLSADVYGYRLRVEELYRDESFTRDEWRAGARLTLIAGPKTSIRASVNFASIDPDATETWTGRMEIGYHFTDTFFARLLYQHQNSSSDLLAWNYTENLFFLSLTKYFR